VITSLIYSLLQVAKKQNIVYLGRVSVTNALSVSLSLIVFKRWNSHERRKLLADIECSVGVMLPFFLKSLSYSLIHNFLHTVD
jgi:hypothetical protein